MNISRKYRELLVIGVVLLLGVSVLIASVLYIRQNRGISSVPLIAAPTAKPSSIISPRCASTAHFETGITYPQWSPTGYGSTDRAWMSEIQQIQTETGACWLEIPLLFVQTSPSVAIIGSGGNTPSLGSFASGVQYAHSTRWVQAPGRANLYGICGTCTGRELLFTRAGAKYDLIGQRHQAREAAAAFPAIFKEAPANCKKKERSHES